MKRQWRGAYLAPTIITIAMAFCVSEPIPIVSIAVVV